MNKRRLQLSILRYEAALPSHSAPFLQSAQDATESYPLFKRVKIDPRGARFDRSLADLPDDEGGMMTMGAKRWM